MDALPWEVHNDRITINYEFPLGEGNSYVIYLGKLRGKAPIMQWANLGEMKQFQDCAVAVRVSDLLLPHCQVQNQMIN